MKKYLELIFWIVLCEAVGAAGSFFTVSSIPTWYASINQPSFTPPNWLFGPVWILLYAMMGIAIFMVRKKKDEGKDTRFAQRIFFLQLALNAIWTPIFFGLNNIVLALVVIVLLWISIAWTIKLFWNISRPAAYLLTPYIIWVSYATALNAAFLLLN